jgi:3-oxoacyl-(acyl-carrier-protein) synthase
MKNQPDYLITGLGVTSSIGQGAHEFERALLGASQKNDKDSLFLCQGCSRNSLSMGFGGINTAVCLQKH